MKKVFAVLSTLAALLAVFGLIFAPASRPALAKTSTLLEFETMTGVPKAYTGALMPIRGINGGGLPWVVSQYNTSPDLAGLLQGLVKSRGGLASGSHLQLWVRGGQQTQNDLGTPDFSVPGYSTNPATLTISACF